MPLDHASACSDVATCRSSSRDHSIKVDTQFICMLPNPPNGGFPILHTFKRSGLMCLFNTILGRDRNKPQCGKISSLLIELPRRPTVPTTTKEKNNCLSFFMCRCLFGLEYIRWLINSINNFINIAIATLGGICWSARIFLLFYSGLFDFENLSHHLRQVQRNYKPE